MKSTRTRSRFRAAIAVALLIGFPVLLLPLSLDPPQRNPLRPLPTPFFHPLHWLITRFHASRLRLALSTLLRIQATTSSPLYRSVYSIHENRFAIFDIFFSNVLNYYSAFFVGPVIRSQNFQPWASRKRILVFFMTPSSTSDLHCHCADVVMPRSIDLVVVAITAASLHQRNGSLLNLRMRMRLAVI